MFFDRPDAGKRALLLQMVFTQSNNAAAAEASLAELKELSAAIELEVCGTVTGKRPAPHPRWFVGEGKVEEIRQAVQSTSADMLLVNHELSAGQQRNLERELDVRVLTRTELILHIFSARAQTHEGQLQVELAQLEHARTRLVRGWTHLDRQKGGIGLKGAGETQIELDQRMLGERIKMTRKRLDEVARRRALSRKRRQRNETPVISLVGYTNAGKSTLFNRLTAGDVLVADQLFATLDPTMRRIAIEGVGECVVADTVGFISELPHTLVEAFKATLEEVAEADLLLHVVDASDARAAEKVADVKTVLEEIGAHENPTLVVLNKTDRAQRLPDGLEGVAVSALTGAGLDGLKRAIGDAFGVARPAMKVLLRAGDGRTRAWLYKAGAVMDETVHEDGSLELTVRADEQLAGQLARRQEVLLRHA